MNRSRSLALAGAVLVLSATAGAAAASSRPGSAASAGTTVTVRIEGAHKTLQAPAVVHTHSGWITRLGAPRGKCADTSAAGALDIDTHHRWRGSWSTKFDDFFVTSIDGESDNGPKVYWSIFVNNVAASTGMCEIRLHHGDQVLFAATVYPEYPLALSAPHSAKVGHAFNVKVVWFNGKGQPEPLEGAHVAGKVTNHRGIATITPTRAGILTLGASKKGYVRAVPVSVHVSA